MVRWYIERTRIVEEVYIVHPGGVPLKTEKENDRDKKVGCVRREYRYHIPATISQDDLKASR